MDLLVGPLEDELLVVTGFIAMLVAKELSVISDTLISMSKS